MYICISVCWAAKESLIETAPLPLSVTSALAVPGIIHAITLFMHSHHDVKNGPILEAFSIGHRSHMTYINRISVYSTIMYGKQILLENFRGRKES
jgi:hypothetical protein